MPTFNAAGLALLRQLEACRLTAYPDQAQHWTIGYGHTGPDVVPGLVWTQAHADAALASDTMRFSTGVAALLQAPLNDNQFSALVIFAFNIGMGAFAGSTALHRVNVSDLAGVPDAMRLFNKVTDPTTHQLVVNQGLVNRREAEIALWNKSIA